LPSNEPPFPFAPRPANIRAELIKAATEQGQKLIANASEVFDRLRKKGYALEDFSEVESFIEKHGHLVDDLSRLATNPDDIDLAKLDADLRSAAFDLEFIDGLSKDAAGPEADFQSAASKTPESTRPLHLAARQLVAEGVTNGWLTDEIVKSASQGVYGSVKDLQDDLKRLVYRDMTGVDRPLEGEEGFVPNRAPTLLPAIVAGLQALQPD
jgi:hypothetical protein